MAKSIPPVEPVDLDFANQFHLVYRRARLNVIYYGRRLWWVQFADRVVGVAVGVGASAAVGSLAVWRTEIGRGTFLGLTATAIVLQAIRPVLNLSAAIARLSKMWTAYSGAFETLDRLHAELWIHDGRVASAEPQLLDVMARIGSVAASEDASPSGWLVRRAREETERQMPVDRLWAPYDDVNGPEEPSGLAAPLVGAGPAPSATVDPLARR